MHDFILPINKINDCYVFELLKIYYMVKLIQANNFLNHLNLKEQQDACI